MVQIGQKKIGPWDTIKWEPVYVMSPLLSAYFSSSIWKQVLKQPEVF